MEAASISREFVPVDPEFVRQIGKYIQKLLVAARTNGISADRVILLGRRQRADGRENQARGQGRRRREQGRERGNLQETIFTEFVPEH